MRTISIKSLDLEITTRCNLMCQYCYINLAERSDLRDMSDETIELVLDLIEKFGYPRPYLVDANGVKSKKNATQIAFYGGEPILAFDRVRKFVNRSIERGMKLNFSLLSNGTVGTQEQANWLKAHNIWVQRSIDGYPEAQEKYRKNSVDAYIKCNEIFKDYDSSRRMTVRPEFAKDLLKSQKFFESMGFYNGISPMPDYYADWTDEQINDFKNSLWDLAKYYVEKWKEGKPFYNYYFNSEIIGRFIMQRSDFGCGGGRNLFAVDKDGWVYLCHRFTSDPHNSPFCFGHIKEILEGTAKGFDKEVEEQISKHEKGNPQDWYDECKTCLAQYGCEKGCMHTNIKTTGYINRPPKLYCEIRKTATECVLWIDIQLRHLDRKWYLKPPTLKTNNERIRKMIIEYQRSKNIPPRPVGATSLWCQPDFPNNSEKSNYYWR
ncbi:MAG: radical SAM protein [Thermoplasmata archaeon]